MGVNHHHYAYRTEWIAEDHAFVGTCVEFPSLSWVADSDTEAYAGIRDLVAEVVADLVAAGEVVPAPLSVRDYSGRFVVRVSKSLHRSLTIAAAEEGVSLNQLAVQRLARA